jgi:hypothetical protein
MAFDSYRLHPIKRTKSPAAVRPGDELVARVASAVSSLLRGVARPVRTVRRSFPAAVPGLPRPA